MKNIATLFFCLLTFQLYAEIEKPVLQNCRDQGYSIEEFHASFACDSDIDSILYCLLQNALLNKSNSTLKSEAQEVAYRHGRLRSRQALYPAACNYFIYAYMLAKQENETEDAVKYLDHLSYNYYRYGEIYDAYKAINKGFALASNSKLLVRCHNRISWIYWRIERFQDAQFHIEKYKELAPDFTTNIRTQYTYNNAKMVFLSELKNYEEARFYAKLAIQNAIDLNRDDLEALAISNLTDCYKKGSNLSVRIEYMKEVLAINLKNKNKEQIGANHALIANHYLENHQYKKAIKNYFIGFKHVIEIEDKPREHIIYKGLSAAYAGLKNYDKAYEFKEKEKLIYEKLYGAQSLAKIFELEKELSDKVRSEELEKIENRNKIEDLKLQKQRNRFFILSLMSLLALVIGWFYFYRLRQKQFLDQALQENKLLEKLRAIEIQSLRSQMNPHFIFNCLNSIKSYIATNEPRTATKYLNKFAQLIRLILSNSKSKLITLQEEIDALSLYVELELLRLDNSFDFTIDIAPNVLTSQLKIAPMVLQPYVENAIWHGIVQKTGEKKIRLHITEVSDFLIISIKDNGIGRTASKTLKEHSSKKSYGMSITKDRIRLMNTIKSQNTIHINDLVSHSGDALGTEVIIKIKKLI